MARKLIPVKQSFPCICLLVEIDVCAGYGVQKQTPYIISRV